MLKIVPAQGKTQKKTVEVQDNATVSVAVQAAGVTGKFNVTLDKRPLKESEYDKTYVGPASEIVITEKAIGS